MGMGLVNLEILVVWFFKEKFVVKKNFEWLGFIAKGLFLVSFL